MGKRKTILILLLLMIVSAIIFAWWSSEPRYQGRGLSYWLKFGYSTTSSREQARLADEAMRNIGTNGLPILLKIFDRRNESLFAGKINALLNRQSVIKFRFASRAGDPSQAYYALHALGPDMKGAVPDLSRLIGNRAIGSKAATLLADIGPEGFRFLTNALASPDAQIRGCVALGLAGYGRPGVYFSTKASSPLASNDRIQEVVPVLIRCLQDPKPIVRMHAAQSLALIGAEADTVVPALAGLLKDRDIWNGSGTDVD